MGAELTAGVGLLGRLGQPFGHLGRRVTPAPETGLLLGRRRRFEEQQQGVGPVSQDLARPLDVDLEDQVVARRRVRGGGAVQVAEELGVFEEATLVDAPLERRPVDEDVGVIGLARTLVAGCPRPAQPEVGNARDQPLDDGPLADPARARDDDDEGLGQEKASTSD
jgi:hypothetical protein